MAPRWFKTEEVPFDQMWEESRYWIPPVLKGEREGMMVFHHVQFLEGWERITRRAEKWVKVDENHGGREGDIGRRALDWVELVRCVVRN